jgi:hypothetical protein
LRSSKSVPARLVVVLVGISVALGGAVGCTSELEATDLPADPTGDWDEPEDELPADPADPVEVPPDTSDEEPHPAEKWALDRFGVRKVYPTIAGGREWFLPTNAEVANPEWDPNAGHRGTFVRTSEAGVFRLRGGPRLPVKAPAGKAWFRNMEVTAYYRYRASLPEAEQQSPYDMYGFQILVRGEMHRTGTVSASVINGGVAPPAGTVAGPGYPFRAGTSVNAHCLGASMHGFIDVNGRARFKKELSHTEGYSAERAPAFPFGGPIPRNRWFGYKMVVRNLPGDTGVHLESWIDVNGDGVWRKVTETNDTGGWIGQDAHLDGCSAAPFRYSAGTRITWAGPVVLFRMDNIEADIKSLSVREIAAL